MKKNLVMRIAAVVLMCTLVTACFASSTFARYTSQATTSTSTATVAKWNVEVNGADITVANPTVTFNLFDSSKIWDTVDKANKATDADVASGLIAPGTYGEYEMTVENKSEVNAKFKIDNAITNANNVPINLEVKSVKIGNTIITADADKYYAIGMNEKAIVTYGWEWAFGEKSVDNAYGDHSKDIKVVVAATIEVDQVD